MMVIALAFPAAVVAAGPQTPAQPFQLLPPAQIQQQKQQAPAPQQKIVTSPPQLPSARGATSREIVGVDLTWGGGPASPKEGGAAKPAMERSETGTPGIGGAITPVPAAAPAVIGGKKGDESGPSALPVGKSREIAGVDLAWAGDATPPKGTGTEGPVVGRSEIGAPGVAGMTISAPGAASAATGGKKEEGAARSGLLAETSREITGVDLKWIDGSAK